jgi:hypothetical protein
LACNASASARPIPLAAPVTTAVKVSAIKDILHREGIRGDS